MYVVPLVNPVTTALVAVAEVTGWVLTKVVPLITSIAKPVIGEPPVLAGAGEADRGQAGLPRR